MIHIKPQELSQKYRVVDAQTVDLEELFALYCSNRFYFTYFSLPVTREQLIKDMNILPDGCEKAQKHFLAYYDKERLIAILDLIEGYPDEKTCYIGMLMVAKELHRQGIGTAVITELCDALSKLGYEAVRLAYGKHYDQAASFWTKNGFVPEKEAWLEEYGELIVAQKML